MACEDFVEVDAAFASEVRVFALSQSFDQVKPRTYNVSSLVTQLRVCDLDQGIAAVLGSEIGIEWEVLLPMPSEVGGVD